MRFPPSPTRCSSLRATHGNEKRAAEGAVCNNLYWWPLVRVTRAEMCPEWQMFSCCFVAIEFRMETRLFLLQQLVDLAHKREQFFGVLLLLGKLTQLAPALFWFVHYASIWCNLTTTSPKARKRLIAK